MKADQISMYCLQPLIHQDMGLVVTWSMDVCLCFFCASVVFESAVCQGAAS